MAPKSKTPASKAKARPTASPHKVSTGRVTKRSSKSPVTFHDDPEKILREARKANPKKRSTPIKNSPSDVSKTSKLTTGKRRKLTTSKKNDQSTAPSKAKPRSPKKSPSPISRPLSEYASWGIGWAAGSLPYGSGPEGIAKAIGRNAPERAYGKPKKYSPPHQEPARTTYKPKKHKSAPGTSPARSMKGDAKKAKSFRF